MRDAYHEELDSIGDSLVEMARLVGSAIGRATTAILDSDLKLAESVIEADQKVDELQHDLEAKAIALLARQQPVATDLRIVVTSLRMSADLERSGDLALQLESDDDAMDLLHRALFQHLLDDRWKHGIETAVDVTLLGRYYERFADHAVAVAKRVVFLVTGEHADELQPDIQPDIQPTPVPGGDGA